MSRLRYEAERVADRLTKRQQWARWRAAGACGDCGVPVDRFARCLVHRLEHASHNLAYWHRQKVAA